MYTCLEKFKETPFLSARETRERGLKGGGNYPV